MKYYVTFGDHESVHNAMTPYQACMLAFKDFTTQGYVDALPVSFRVSQRGFDIHDEDEVINSDLIIKLNVLNNEYNADHKHNEDIMDRALKDLG